MNTCQKMLHVFNPFTVFISWSGDYVAETLDGELIILLSPDGSSEHEHTAQWIADSSRTVEDFLDMDDELAMSVKKTA